MSELTIERVPINSLHEAESNPRTHDERNLAAIRESIARWGQVEPLVVLRATGEVVAGNGRLQVFRDLGWSTVDVVYVDMDGQEAAALAIALNRSGELGGWDYDALSQVLDSLRGTLDVEVTGWTEAELDGLFGDHAPVMDGIEPIESKELPEGSDASRCKPIFVTPDQRETIDRAVYELRQREDAQDMTEGRAVELMAADWLSGR